MERLNVLYQNDPRPEHRERSYPHLGSCSFHTARLIPPIDPRHLLTDRYTQGEMDIHLVDRSKGYTSYQDAAAHMTELRSGN